MVKSSRGGINGTKTTWVWGVLPSVLRNSAKSNAFHKPRHEAQLHGVRVYGIVCALLR